MQIPPVPDLLFPNTTSLVTIPHTPRRHNPGSDIGNDIGNDIRNDISKDIGNDNEFRVGHEGLC